MSKNNDVEWKALLEREGAVWSAESGARLATSFGDPAAEAVALREGCAVWVDLGSDLVEMVGEDRHRFLNGMITADVLELAAGSGRFGLFTTIKGRVLADVLVVVRPDRLWLRLPPGRGAAVLEHMNRYVITDRVELRALEEQTPIMLGGPAASERLSEWLVDGEPPSGSGRHVGVRIRGVEAIVLREPRGPAVFSIWLPHSTATGLLAGLLEGSDAPVLVGEEAVERARVEAGVPRFGTDFDEETFPQEADLDAAVSYEKGCYLGQEVVARIHFRGGVNRVLRGLEIEADADVKPGEKLLSGGEAVGRVTSVAGPGSRRALGRVAIAVEEGGGQLELESGVPVRLVALPFSSD